MKSLRYISLSVILMTAISCAPTGFHDNHVIAHRGAWKDTGLPQNSLASFKAAAEMGCHGSECDVWLTADDSLVVYHDAKRDDKRIDEMTYEEVISVPLSNGELIPTLREYIKVSREYPRTKLIIDLKTHKEPERTVRMFEKVYYLVKELDYESSVEYLIGYLPAYKDFSKLTDRPVAYLGVYRKESPEMCPDSVAAYGLKYLDYHYAHYERHPEWVEKFKQDGVHLNAWAANDEERMKTLLEMGFDYLTTDHPGLLLSIEKQ